MCPNASNGNFVRKHPFLVLIGLLLLVALALVAGIFYADFIQPIRARDNSIRLLATADTTASMEEAVGHLGVIFHIRDGAWIAIRYVDHHHGGFWSSAVALDSGGEWAVSDRHFCGSFKIYRHQWAQAIQLIGMPDVSTDEKKAFWLSFRKHAPDLWAIENAESLDVARDKMLGIGFRQYFPDLQPKMTGQRPESVDHKMKVVQKMIAE